MKQNIRQIWAGTLRLIIDKPVLLFPFVFSAFFQVLALELIYFSPRPPMTYIISPIIRKFFGEAYLHYPLNFLLLPRLSYYADLVIYVFVGTFVTGICINIYKNISSNVPFKSSALLKNALKRYVSYVLFGIIIIILTYALKRVDTFLYAKLMIPMRDFAPNFTAKFNAIGLSLFLYFTNIILQVFLVLTLPIMVLQKKSFFISLGISIMLGFRHFFRLFVLLMLPFIVYLPIMLLKTNTYRLIDLTFPGVTLLVTAAGILSMMCVDCFITVTSSQFLTNTQK